MAQQKQRQSKVVPYEKSLLAAWLKMFIYDTLYNSQTMQIAVAISQDLCICHFRFPGQVRSVRKLGGCSCQHLLEMAQNSRILFIFLEQSCIIAIVNVVNLNLVSFVYLLDVHAA